jgi:sulfatase modifying factor 1
VARSSLALWLAAAPALGGCGGLVGLKDVPVTDAADSGPDGTTDGTIDGAPDGDSGDASDFATGDDGGPRSCRTDGAGRSDCAPGTGGVESCCTSLAVTGGGFHRTYTNDGTGPTGEADPATVSSFRLDKYDVTVGRFRAFVAAVLPGNGGVGWLPSPGSGKHTHLDGGQGLAAWPDVNGAPAHELGWLSNDDGNIAPTDANLACTSTEVGYPTWTPSPGDNENLPIDCVNWAEAYAFCIWDGGFLPSEAEWEYAAAGGSQELEYPWGATDPGVQTQYAVYDCLYHGKGEGTCSGVTNIAPVGLAAQGAGSWGQLDLVGNVWQWNLDAYASYASPCTNCASLTPGDRVARGGAFDNRTGYLLPPFRGYRAPDRYPFIGVRCARAP